MFKRAIVTNRDIHQAVTDLTRQLDRHIASTDLRLRVLEQTEALRTGKAWQVRLAVVGAVLALPTSVLTLWLK